MASPSRLVACSNSNLHPLVVRSITVSRFRPNDPLLSKLSEMGVSRSVFAERFVALTKATPQQYLTNLRMRLASQWISREKLPLDEVADRLGYASVAAFSRAFKRTTGKSPGAIRHIDYASP